MTTGQRKYAVKLYQRRIKEDPDYTEAMFGNEVYQHFLDVQQDATEISKPNAFDPFTMSLQISKLWRALSMDMKDVVAYSGMKMSEFSERFVIPYRTLQDWCNGTNPCPIYTKLMLCEILGIISVEVTVKGFYRNGYL